MRLSLAGSVVVAMIRVDTFEVTRESVGGRKMAAELEIVATLYETHLG